MDMLIIIIQRENQFNLWGRKQVEGNLISISGYKLILDRVNRV